MKVVTAPTQPNLTVTKAAPSANLNVVQATPQPQPQVTPAQPQQNLQVAPVQQPELQMPQPQETDHGTLGQQAASQLDEASKQELASLIQQMESSQKYTPEQISGTVQNYVKDHLPKQTQTQPAQPPQQSGLLQELGNRTSDVKQAVTQSLQGKINPLSGLLQVGGAIGGAIGDVTNKALELVPGVKWLENEVGKGVGGLAKTEAGQSILKSVSDFSQAHPELSKDIGASFNILTAIPILKGASVVANLAKDSTALAIKSAAEKIAVKDLTEVASRTIGGRAALDIAPDGLKELVQIKAVPDFITEGGVTRYSTQEARQVVNNAIKKIDDVELQPVLKEASEPFNQVKLQNAGRLSLDPVRQTAMNLAKDELHDTKAVNSILDRVEAKFGEYPSTEQLNEAKRLLSKQISESAFNDPNMTNLKIARKALQQEVEDRVSFLKLPNAADINQKMARLIKAQDLLDAIEGKAVKNTGLGHQIIRAASTAGGAASGGIFGNPLVGGLVGNQAAGYIEGRLGKLSLRRLSTSAIKRAALYEEQPLLQSTKQISKKGAKTLQQLFLETQAQKINK